VQSPVLKFDQIETETMQISTGTDGLLNLAKSRELWQSLPLTHNLRMRYEFESNSTLAEMNPSED